MPTIEHPLPAAATGLPLLEQLRAATELLELVAADWRLLEQLPAADRRRLHQAIAGLSVPDPRARRKRTKAANRERKADSVRHDEAMLNETGIRTLRRRPTVTTPNVFPPEAFEPRDVDDAAPASGASVGERHCCVCKQTYSRVDRSG